MNSDKNRVAPKVWLVTGCSTGFGRALAEADSGKTGMAQNGFGGLATGDCKYGLYRKYGFLERNAFEQRQLLGIELGKGQLSWLIVKIAGNEILTEQVSVSK